jgi:hypothetical protein
MSGYLELNLNHWWTLGTYPSVYGGWSGCDMRYDILGSTNVPPSGYGAQAVSGRTGYDATSTCATNPVPNTLMSVLPSDLRAVIAPWTIYTHNSPLGTKGYNTEASVTATVDYLPLLSQYEVFGTYDSSGMNANQYEHNHQYYMSFYANGGTTARTMYYRNARIRWWLRSPAMDSLTAWIRVAEDANKGEENATHSLGLSPAFRVA